MTFTKTLVGFSLVLLSVFLGADAVVAQPTQIGGEFIESTSPLRNGGTVTTRAEPGRRVQTTVTVASNRLALPTRSGTGAGQPTPVNPNNSVLQSNRSSTTAARQNVGSTYSNTSSRYPYPATYNPRVAYNPAVANPNQMNAARVQLPANCNCAPLPVNGLGLTPAPRYNNTLGGTRIPTSSFQATGQPLVGQGVQPVMSQPPQLQYQIPGQNPVVPQYGNVNPAGATSPWVTGSPGAYQPLVRVFNPQGAFMGQGVLGQPEAYVNGQPVANFFRYLLPF